VILIYSRHSVSAFDPFDLRFMQLAAAEVALLSILAGLLGAQIVLRGLAFYSHAVGAGAFPGLVLASAWGVQPQAAALGTGVIFAGGLERLSRAGRTPTDAATALLLVAALALGIVLASDVFESGSEVDQLLFGTLVGISEGELAASAVAVAAAASVWLCLRRVWVASAFDSGSARSMGLPVAVADWLLLAAIALAVVASLDAVGSLLVSAILVVPAATARVMSGTVAGLELGAFAIALVEGELGLWLAYQLDAPPGPAIAVLSGAVFIAVALFVAWRGRVGGGSR
jgi:ABC-type Mn2+/Zn2+ transport system permease subunit